MNESEKQFSLTRAASSTSGRAKKQILISNLVNRFNRRDTQFRQPGIGRET
jgi:hypothetical protein